MLWTIKAVDTGSEQSGEVSRNDIVKTDRHDEPVKERPSRRNKKKEKENMEKASKPSIKSKIEKRLMVLPLETSIIGLFLLVLLGAFYVVCILLPQISGIFYYFLASLYKMYLYHFFVAFVVFDTSVTYHETNTFL